MSACVDSITVINCAGFPGNLIDGQFNTSLLISGSSLLGVILFGEDVATGLEKLKLGSVVSSR